ncbi:hypothetical protein [Corynebacterium sp.]|uniref:hypothetical protein n=1 Tax=Corynebacterium sp. TaxID=1720 RepID=UPI0028AF074F|nr:hypothetical protein [Corynebacterium sp.]
MFEKFIDDAAVFPPGLATLPDAVAKHLENQGLSAAHFMGPLVLPLKDVTEASRLAGGTPLDVSVVTPPGALDDVTALRDALPTLSSVVAVELKVNADGDLSLDDQLTAAASYASDHGDLAVWVELPFALVDSDRLGWMREHGLGLKFRTGGVSRSLYPTPAELLAVLQTAVEAGLKFKLTAGLHRALRYSEPGDGEVLDHFGFLNIAAAVVALRAGDSDRAEALLGSDNGADLLRTVQADDDWRSSFVSFGACSILEPLTTLNELGGVDDNALAGLTEPTSSRN